MTNVTASVVPDGFTLYSSAHHATCLTCTRLAGEAVDRLLAAPSLGGSVLQIKAMDYDSTGRTGDSDFSTEHFAHVIRMRP